MPNVRTLIPASASGSGSGVYNNTSVYFLSKPVKGSFDKNGLIVITGTDIIDVEEWKHEQSPAALEAWFKILNNSTSIKWKEFYNKLHWTDILALSEVSKTKGVNPYTKLQGYHAGDNNYVYMDEQSILQWIKEIYDSGGAKDWNLIIKRMFPPVVEDQKQPESPFNPDSPIYDLSKPVFAYDPDNGYVIYKSGEILWQKKAGNYYDKANGAAVSYDKANQTVTFANGAVLNLVTLELVQTNKETVVIRNTLPWYKKTITLLIIIGVLLIVIYIKYKRDNA